MGFGASSNNEATEIQRENLKLSRESFELNKKALEANIEQAKTLKLPKLAPPQPLPTMTSADAVAQLRETRRNFTQRAGLNSTRVVPNAMGVATVV